MGRSNIISGDSTDNNNNWSNDKYLGKSHTHMDSRGDCIRRHNHRHDNEKGAVKETTSTINHWLKESPDGSNRVSIDTPEDKYGVKRYLANSENIHDYNRIGCK